MFALKRPAMTAENDIVLIYLEEEPLSFARIESIQPDVKRDWYHVKLLLLQIPLQTVTWILRDIYIDGETYTMGGKAMRLEKVVCPAEKLPDGKTPSFQKAPRKKEGNVISLADLKKK
jgi:hypothetical protein